MTWGKCNWREKESKDISINNVSLLLLAIYIQYVGFRTCIKQHLPHLAIRRRRLVLCVYKIFLVTFPVVDDLSHMFNAKQKKIHATLFIKLDYVMLQ